MIFILETVVERIDVMVGMKCGCLQVLDDGEEYRKIIEKRISNIEEEKKNFLQAVEKNLRRGVDRGGETVYNKHQIRKQTFA